MRASAIDDSVAHERIVRERATRYVIRFSKAAKAHGVSDDFSVDDALRVMAGDRCHFCGGELRGAFERCLDHLKPLSRGGDNVPLNVVLCCDICRGNRMRTLRFH